MDCFDADVLIFAAAPGNPMQRRLAALFADTDRLRPAGVGSVLLIPEVLAKPRRVGATDEVLALAALLGRLDLLAVDQAVAERASEFGSQYNLRAADAVHLATAVSLGADRFLTNNRRDFPKSITEVDVVYPEDLPENANDGESA